MGPVYFDDMVVETFMKERTRVQAVMDALESVNFTAVYWAKITAKEKLRLFNPLGSVIVESLGTEQTHLLKFQLELPRSSVNDESYDGGQWRLADIDNFASVRLRREMVTSETRIRPSHDYSLSSVWTNVVDVA